MVAPAGYPTFPCGRCGAALPATFAAGMVIACPMCRTSIVVPAGGGPTRAQSQDYQAWHMVVGATAAAAGTQRAHATSSPHAPPPPFAAGAVPVVVEDGNGGLVIVGPQLDDNGWHVRGVDPMTQRTRWEVMHGSFFTTPPEARSVCDRFRRIFVAHHGVLVAIDAPRGRVLWQARLPDRVATSPGDATLVGDETCLRDVGGAIVVRTEDERVTAFDRDTGAALWQRACDGVPQNDTASLLLPQGHRVWDLVRPRDGGTVARFAASEARLVRGAVVLAVDGTGRANDAGGVALADAQTGREHWFVAAEDPELHTGVALVGDRLWVPQNGTTGTLLLPIELATGKAPGAGLFARLFGIRGARGVALPWTKHNLTALWGAGDAIVVDAAAWDGQRRIALVEPRGMRVRHDSGVIPDGVAPGVRLGPGMLVYAFGESNGPKTVRAVDLATGALRWERQLPDLDDIAFRVGALTFRTDGGPIEIVDPATGQTKVTFGH